MTGLFGKWSRRHLLALKLLAGFAVLATGYSLFVPYGLAWNLTSSIPEGLYFSQVLGPSDQVSRGDIVCDQYVAPSWARGRDYGAPKLRMCKPVVGLAGDQVSVRGSRIRITSTQNPAGVEALLLPTDSKGRAMPQEVNPTGPVPLDTVFLMSTYRSNSLDSRYLGPIPRAALTHKVFPLWVRD